MIKRSIQCIFGLCFAWAFQVQAADAQPYKTIMHLSDVKHYVQTELIAKQHIPAKQILVVFDDDNTLLTTPKHCPTPSALTCQYLGGAAWYQWQEQLLKTDPESPFLVAKTIAGLDRVSTLLFAMMPMEPTEPDVPGLLRDLQRMDVSVMIETARSPDMALITWNQLLRNHVALNEHPIGDRVTYYSLPAKRCGRAEWGDQPVSVEDGVLYTSGRDKGRMLSCLLRYKPERSPYRAIVMVDDGAENLVHVHDALSQHYQLSLFRYAALDKKVHAFLHGPNSKAYQAEATARWRSIVQAMARAMPVLSF